MSSPALRKTIRLINKIIKWSAIVVLLLFSIIIGCLFYIIEDYYPPLVLGFPTERCPPILNSKGEWVDNLCDPWLFSLEEAFKDPMPMTFAYRDSDKEPFFIEAKYITFRPPEIYADTWQTFPRHPCQDLYDIEVHDWKFDGNEVHLDVGIDMSASMESIYRVDENGKPEMIYESEGGCFISALDGG